MKESDELVPALPLPRLDLVIGQERTVSHLLHLADHGSVPHALLLSGPVGIGKRTLARAFARKLLASLNGQGGQLADSEKFFQSGNHPDLHISYLQEEKKEISVEQVRELCSAISLRPYLSTLRVSILDDAECMSVAAANALLKTLEEPRPNTYLILTSSAPQLLPETILSRCQLFPCNPLSDSAVNLLLRERFQYPESSALIDIAAGSTEAFHLQSAIDPRTRAVRDLRGLQKLLENANAEAKTLRDSLERVFLHAREEEFSEAMALASSLSAGETSTVWLPVRNYLRGKLVKSTPEEQPFWADSLLAFIKAEKTVTERNGNPSLVLSDFFIRTCRAAERHLGARR